MDEKWKSIWSLCIFSSLISHILSKEELNSKLIEAEKTILVGYAKKLGITYESPLGIYDYFGQILYINDTSDKVDSFIHNIEWQNAKYFVSNNLLRRMPPLYFFLDSLDEEYEHAPQYWLKCQRGLFGAITDLLREPVIREKIHVILCIRDTVFASICRTENQTKISHESHIINLHWNRNTLKYFLEKKIEKLKSCYFIKQNSNKDIFNWLGIDTIHNVTRNIDENIIDYILRHTRHTPRDVINICNSLSSLTMKIKENKALDIQKEIRLIVSSCAKEIGDELITICAKQVVVDEIPEEAGKHDFSSAYTSVDEYTKSRFIHIRTMLSECGKDHFSDSDIQNIEKKAKTIFNTDVHLTDIMWMNGMLGYVRLFEGKEIPTFYMENNSISTIMPSNYQQYVLKSYMIDALDLVDIRSIPVK